MTRTRAACGIPRVMIALVVLLLPAPALCQAAEIHGENSVFSGQGVALAWGVLKGKTEEETQVILRLRAVEHPFAAVRIEGVDPFSQARHAYLEGQPLLDRLDVRTSRGTFADFPRREILLYRTEAEWQLRTPSVIVFFLGLPDTTPEFSSEAALFTYLDAALSTRQGTEGKAP